ncbi:rod shape-determining protein MreD [Alkalibacterium olivapovliticus]|uniref:Rod shape-determining protein MreD n=1 Tax=Alkalibacterium olivapovliticus TaxID=99907 RepID=A0A2T0WB34_9LACT|nr:rod shape-determining protein MreD [Alkalibacterium olivapovliticus]PRY83920.1 rod shape-determining protein MreD [Alkalibacterium olivapovliticus]
MEQWKKVIIPIVLLFFSLLLDGLIVSLFYEQLSVSFGFMSPRLLVLVVIILAFYLEPRHMYTLTLVFGFIYDSYFSGILGIYMAGLTLVAYFVIQLRRIFDANVLIMILMSVIMLTFLEFFVFGVHKGIDLTALTTQEFLATRLSASLLFNTISAIVLVFPIKQAIQLIQSKNKEKSDKSRITYR